jgi:hypothetical protein
LKSEFETRSTVQKLCSGNKFRSEDGEIKYETILLLLTSGREKTFFKKPVILFIDEFDSLPATVIDKIVTLFRDMYLNRDQS